MKKHIVTNCVDETVDLGKKIGSLLEERSLICLRGDLACGKTTFTKGLALGLEIKEVVNSPTFTILKTYYGRIPLFHIDAYRLLDNPYDLGFEELIDDNGVVVIEWFDYLKDILDSEYLEINFKHIAEKSREMEFIAHGQKYEKILEVL